MNFFNLLGPNSNSPIVSETPSAHEKQEGESNASTINNAKVSAAFSLNQQPNQFQTATDDDRKAIAPSITPAKVSSSTFSEIPNTVTIGRTAGFSGGTVVSTSATYNYNTNVTLTSKAKALLSETKHTQTKTKGAASDEVMKIAKGQEPLTTQLTSITDPHKLLKLATDCTRISNYTQPDKYFPSNGTLKDCGKITFEEKKNIIPSLTGERTVILKADLYFENATALENASHNGAEALVSKSKKFDGSCTLKFELTISKGEITALTPISLRAHYQLNPTTSQFSTWERLGHPSTPKK